MGTCKLCLESKQEVKETLGERFRIWLMTTFCSKELRDYQRDFERTGVSIGYKLGFDSGCRASNQYNTIDDDLTKFELKSDERTTNTYQQ